MFDEVNDVKVVEENDNEVVITDLMPIEAEEINETSETNLSKQDMVVGGLILGLAAAGAVALGRGIYKGSKAIISKIKDKRLKKDEIIPPPTEEINEQSIVVETADVEVIDEESTTE